MLLSCPHCAARMPATAAFCPACGQPMPPAPGAQEKAGILRENIAGALAYLTFIPAVVFLLLNPYRRNRFVRFHSAQCLLLWIAAVLTAIALRLLTMLLFLIPVAGPLLILLLSTVAVLAAFLIWLVLLVKALQGELFKVPVLGNFAEQYANSVSTVPG